MKIQGFNYRAKLSAQQLFLCRHRNKWRNYKRPPENLLDTGRLAYNKLRCPWNRWDDEHNAYYTHKQCHAIGWRIHSQDDMVYCPHHARLFCADREISHKRFVTSNNYLVCNCHSCPVTNRRNS